MAVEYDLVVIGNSPEGIYAAATAARLKARVALVEQSLNLEEIYLQTLCHAARIPQQLRHASDLNIFTGQLPPTHKALLGVKAWAEEVQFSLSEEQSGAVLAALGVDYISGAGEFCRQPHQAFVVNGRQLRSRAYLIATGSRPSVPPIDGLAQSPYLTPATLWPQLAALPQTLTIVGGTPVGVELAQSLSRLGKNVTLIVESQLLPQEDREAALLIQAQLEADGVKILLDPVTQVRQIAGKKWVQAGNRAVEADEIILATATTPNVEGLNLAAVGVKLGQQGVVVNSKLQTANRCIYACGDVAGGYSLTHVAQYEATVALRNALFLPLFRVDYRFLPWAFATAPQLGRVGLTEAQARKHYEDIVVVQQYFKSVARAQVTDETTGLCKLLVRPSGEILGAHIVGPEAGEMIGAVAVAMKNRVKLGAMQHLFPGATLADALNQAIEQWRRDRTERNKTLHSLLEPLFILRKNWSSR